jgi:hypothetical protein
MKDEMKSPSNFERLVLGCIDSYDSDQRLILLHFSRSTRFAFLCTAQISKFQQKKNVQIFAGMKMKIRNFIFHSRFSMKFAIFRRNFDEILPDFHVNVQEMTNCLEILRKVREKFGKCYKFPEFVRNFHFSFHFFIRVLTAQPAARRRANRAARTEPSWWSSRSVAAVTSTSFAAMPESRSATSS